MPKTVLPQTAQGLLPAIQPVAQAVLLCLVVAATALVNAQSVGQRPGSANMANNAATALPDLGDGTEMTPTAERQLGDSIARVLYKDLDYIDDPVIMQYVQEIWKPLLAAAKLRGDMPPEQEEAYAWEILLGKDRTVNAFAMPGGYLALNLGLIAMVANRDELASVMAHELSHVTQRHIARSMSRQSSQTPMTIATTILGILAATKDPNVGLGLIYGGQGAAAQAKLGFSRDVEREADRIGFGVMTQAGFVPEGFVGMFEKLDQSNRLNDSGGFPYLRTHPLTTERIADIKARIPPGTQQPAPPTPLDHAMVSARARVLANPEVDALRLWQQELDSTSFAKRSAAAQAGSFYGATLAGIKLQDFSGARAVLQRLLERTRSDPAAREIANLLGAELALAEGNPKAAAQYMSEVTGKGRSAVLMRARVNTQNGNAAKAAQMLQTWVADHPRDAQAWLLLSFANEKLGRTMVAVRDQAEADVAHLDYASALERLKRARELGRENPAGVDPIEMEIVNSRVRQVELLLGALREQSPKR